MAMANSATCSSNHRTTSRPRTGAEECEAAAGQPAHSTVLHCIRVCAIPAAAALSGGKETPPHDGHSDHGYEIRRLEGLFRSRSMPGMRLRSTLSSFSRYAHSVDIVPKLRRGGSTVT